MKPKIININSLSSVDPTKDCFIIKDVLDPKICTQITNQLVKFSDDNPENFRVNGENWHYFVRSHGNYFDSFIFNDLDKLGSSELKFAFRMLYNLYKDFGASTFCSDFEKEIKISDFVTDYSVINPLVFRYFNEKSIFGFHKHDPRNQKFQLLMNLSSPGVDYVGGYTYVYMNDSKPNLDCIDYERDCVIFDEDFSIGDVFSFPYHLWHKVDMPLNSESVTGLGARFSLLMPLGHRNSEKYKNEVI